MIDLSVLVFIFLTFHYSYKDYNKLKEVSKGNVKELLLLKYIRSIEIRNIMMFVVIYILSLGLR